MTLALSPDRSDAVSKAIREIGRKVHEATLASDTAAARKALNEIWWAVHEAAERLNEAEAATRDEALAQLRERSAA